MPEVKIASAHKASYPTSVYAIGGLIVPWWLRLDQSTGIMHHYQFTSHGPPQETKQFAHEGHIATLPHCPPTTNINTWETDDVVFVAKPLENKEASRR